MQKESMYHKWKSGKIARKEYNKWWAQHRGFKNYNEYLVYCYPRDKDRIQKSHIKYLKNHPNYSKEYYQKYKNQIISDNQKEYVKQYKKQWFAKNPSYFKEYYMTPLGKIAYKKSVFKRKKCLGYIPLNEWEATTKEFEGHHLDKEYVLFIPAELHKSIPHNIHNGKNMDKINKLVIDWYIKYYDLR